VPQAPAAPIEREGKRGEGEERRTPAGPEIRWGGGGAAIRRRSSSTSHSCFHNCYSTPPQPPIGAPPGRRLEQIVAAWRVPLLLTWLCPFASSASSACRSALPRLTSTALPPKDSWLLFHDSPAPSPIHVCVFSPLLPLFSPQSSPTLSSAALLFLPLFLCSASLYSCSALCYL